MKKESFFESVIKSATARVVSAIVFSIIIFMFDSSRNMIINLITWFWSHVLIVVWAFLSNDISIKGWILTGLTGLSGVFIFLIILKVILHLKESESIAAYSLYRKDKIKGALWRWNWKSGQIKNLSPYCPSCDCELVYNDQEARSRYTSEPTTYFICEKCHDKEVSRITGGDYFYAIGSIEREIRRRVRTNEYRDNQNHS